MWQKKIQYSSQLQHLEQVLLPRIKDVCLVLQVHFKEQNSSPMHFGGTLPSPGNSMDHDGGITNMLPDANKTVQVGRQNSTGEMSVVRSAASRDTGKSPVHASSGIPFKEQQLKQLRAQCLVFLAFRNGMMPKKLHLDIALGNTSTKEALYSLEIVAQSNSGFQATAEPP